MGFGGEEVKYFNSSFGMFTFFFFSFSFMEGILKGIKQWFQFGMIFLILILWREAGGGKNFMLLFFRFE